MKKMSLRPLHPAQWTRPFSGQKFEQRAQIIQKVRKGRRRVESLRLKGQRRTFNKWWGLRVSYCLFFSTLAMSFWKKLSIPFFPFTATIEIDGEPRKHRKWRKLESSSKKRKRTR
jgi:hypothetical protein